jgi:uncharacterized SAM-binding protein YcdF (DUF218 family)
LSILLKHPKWKKRSFWAGIVLLYLFSNDFIANEVITAWEIPTKPISSLKNYEMGIVLTGTTTTPDQPNDRVYFARGADRVTHTVQLYKQGVIKKVLISGGTGRLVNIHDPEADKYKAAMIMMGVSANDIILENQTRNTAESAKAVKVMLDSMNIDVKDCMLITSAFHMRRSLGCYRKAGLDIDNFTTDFYSHPRAFYIDGLLLPQYDALQIWNKLVKEWVGYIAYKLAGYI